MGWTKGDRVADRRDEFTWFFRTEFPGLVRTLFVFCGDRQLAEDVAQEALTKLLVRWKKVENREAWVRRVAFRQILRTLRRDRKRQELEKAEMGSAPDATRDLDLLRSIRQLPSRQRSAVVLFYYEDRPTAEIAEILDCSVATVKVHLHRARKTLGIDLVEEGADVD